MKVLVMAVPPIPFSQRVLRLKHRVESARKKVLELKKELKTTRPQQWGRLLEQTEKIFLDDVDFAQNATKKLLQEEEDLGIVRITDEWNEMDSEMKSNSRQTRIDSTR